MYFLTQTYKYIIYRILYTYSKYRYIGIYKTVIHTATAECEVKSVGIHIINIIDIRIKHKSNCWRKQNVI